MSEFNPDAHWRCPDPEHVIQHMTKPAHLFCITPVFSHMACVACDKANPYMHKGLTVCCEQPTKKVMKECGRPLEFHSGLDANDFIHPRVTGPD